MIQLDPTIPLDTPKGPAHAHVLIDMGQEHHLLWVCFIDETGENWTFPNPEIRLRPNPTMGIRATCRPDREQGTPASEPTNG